MQVQSKNERFAILICVFLCAVVFVMDTRIELGVAGAVPYVAVVLAALYQRREWYVWTFAGICTTLTLLGAYFSPPGGEMWKVIVNRGLAVFAVWVTALLSVQIKRVNQKLREYNLRLEADVKQRTANFQQVNKTLEEQVLRYRQTEEALHAREEGYRHLFTHTPVSIWVEDFTRVGRWLDDLRQEGISDLLAYLKANPQKIVEAVTLVDVVDVNDATLEAFEAKNKEELWAGLGQIFGNDGYDAFIAELCAIWDNRDRIEHETAGYTLRGERRHKMVHWTVPRTNGRLDLSRVLVAVSDITELKEAEGALRSSEQRYRALYDDNPSMYFTITTDLTVSSVNRFGAKRLGYDVKELIGRPLKKLVYADDWDSLSRGINQCLDQPGHIAHWEFRKRTKDGVVVWVKESARATSTGHGKPVILIVCEEITDRKRAEQQLLADSTEVRRRSRCIQPEFTIGQ